MASTQTIFIPMPTHLKRYLLFISENRAEPAIFHDRSDVNILMGRLLTSKAEPMPLSADTCGLVIALPHQRNKDVIWVHNKMSIQSQERFRNWVRNELFFDFRNYIREMLMDDIPRKDAIEIFFDSIGVSADEVNTDSFYRMYTRHLDRKKNNFINLTLENIRESTSRKRKEKKRRIKKYFVNHTQENDQVRKNQPRYSSAR